MTEASGVRWAVLKRTGGMYSAVYLYICSDITGLDSSIYILW